MPSPDFRFTSRVVIGLAVIGMGILFTLDNLGVAQAGELLGWWPVLLIAYGVTRMLGFGARQSWFVGSALTFVGIWTLFSHIRIVNGDIWQFWPLIFVFMGVGIIRHGTWGPRVYGINVPGGRGRRWRRRTFGLDDDASLGGTPGAGFEGAPSSEAATGEPAGTSQAGGAEPGSTSAAGNPGDGGWAGAWVGSGSRRGNGVDTDQRFTVDVFMSSIARKVTAQRFKRGDIVAIMGGGDIDLRSARMESGVAQLEINLLMGGLNLFVPEDWAVEFQGTPVMGSVEDHSRRPGSEPRGRLIITGFVLMSSIVVKN